MREEAGERVLAEAVRGAHAAWCERLAAAYAIGSLAHGGFSAHVSDVDLALVVEGPTGPRDEHAAAELVALVRASGHPLADRLSVFWMALGNPPGSAGRFPPVDLLDLIDHGRLIRGRDVRDGLARPTPRELLVEGARFAHARLATPDALSYLRHPGTLARSGVRALTKFVLFPVRFLYTAETSRVGLNREAVLAFAPVAPAAAAALAQDALRWRERPPPDGSPAVVDSLRRGLRPLYRHFVEDHEARLRAAGEAGLAGQYARWAERIA